MATTEGTEAGYSQQQKIDNILFNVLGEEPSGGYNPEDEERELQKLAKYGIKVPEKAAKGYTATGKGGPDKRKIAALMAIQSFNEKNKLINFLLQHASRQGA